MPLIVNPQIVPATPGSSVQGPSDYKGGAKSGGWGGWGLEGGFQAGIPPAANTRLALGAPCLPLPLQTCQLNGTVPYGGSEAECLQLPCLLSTAHPGGPTLHITVPPSLGYLLKHSPWWPPCVSATAALLPRLPLRQASVHLWPRKTPPQDSVQDLACLVHSRAPKEVNERGLVGNKAEPCHRDGEEPLGLMLFGDPYQPERRAVACCRALRSGHVTWLSFTKGLHESGG
ncbi:hypothetical protein P7K49_036840 [Saguinus oedipus]|uniref:Uncharacterized protein n=1 Tax=Saguinus oedipus TaxID=9490 RepID=A0ABQ9TLZ8_SAGOE|nr:hypothetical protein P7K49_036840 [Saguinus oedipus]